MKILLQVEDSRCFEVDVHFIPLWWNFIGRLRPRQIQTPYSEILSQACDRGRWKVLYDEISLTMKFHPRPAIAAGEIPPSVKFFILYFSPLLLLAIVKSWSGSLLSSCYRASYICISHQYNFCYHQTACLHLSSFITAVPSSPRISSLKSYLSIPFSSSNFISASSLDHQSSFTVINHRHQSSPDQLLLLISSWIFFTNSWLLRTNYHFLFIDQVSSRFCIFTVTFGAHHQSFSLTTVHIILSHINSCYRYISSWLLLIDQLLTLFDSFWPAIDSCWLNFIFLSINQVLNHPYILTFVFIAHHHISFLAIVYIILSHTTFFIAVSALGTCSSIKLRRLGHRSNSRLLPVNQF